MLTKGYEPRYEVSPISS